MFQLFAYKKKEVCSSAVKFSTLDYRSIKSHPGVRSDLFRRPLNEVRITDFLGGVAHVGILPGDEETGGMADIAEPSEEPSIQTHDTFGTRTNATRVEKEQPWRTRSWTAVVLLGGLLGWVFGKG